jgi:PAS domain S-box-containing protein
MKKSTENIFEIEDILMLQSQTFARNKFKYIFSFVGFSLGSVLCIIMFYIEDIAGNSFIFSGSSIWYHLPGLAVMGIMGTLIGYLFSKNQDKKNAAINELLISKKTLSLITDNLPVLISYVDTELRYRFVNKTHEDWLDVSVNDLYGKKIKDFVSEKSFDLISSGMKKALAGEIVNFENARVFQGGKEHFVNSVIVPHFSEAKKVIGFFTIVSDITNLKEREMLINKQNIELAELNATKGKFFSIIAHDLKNPFNTLLGLSELLFKSYEEQDEETRKEAISLIYNTSKNTYKLLENLLVWSHNNSDRIIFNSSSVNIKTMIDENIVLLNSSAINKGIRLKSDRTKDFFINTDKDLIDLVIRNLLSNAIKFTPVNGEIVISATSFKENDSEEYVEISVKDNGIGMNEKDISRLFKISENRSTPGTQGEKGTGLGLVLCRGCVEKCGGKIWVESEVGKGSDFKFTLPIFTEQAT